MCDENIAVSVRKLSTMSNIVPVGIDKLKLASLAAGTVAGFTTDCIGDINHSQLKTYNALTYERNTKLMHAVKQQIILNKAWFETGASVVFKIRNTFITGRRDTLCTIENIFNLTNGIKLAQGIGGELAAIINTARAEYNLYQIPFTDKLSSINDVIADKGLIGALKDYRECIIKTAKRINSEGKRLPILDNDRISTMITPIVAIVLAYAESLPTGQVDFNEYYAKIAYPNAADIVNQVVEEIIIKPSDLFDIYRSVLEMRYELAFVPTDTVKGVLTFISHKDILPELYSTAIATTNTELFKEYIRDMVDGVYQSRKDAVERDVLHNFTGLPVIANPVTDVVYGNESLEMRFSNYAAALEKLNVKEMELLNNLDSKFLRKQLAISTEAISGRQAAGILMIILGGALMAWAVYSTFFKNSASSAKSMADFREQMNKEMQQLDKMMADLGSDANWAATIKAEKTAKAVEGAGLVSPVANNAKAIGKSNNVADIKDSSIVYEAKSNLDNLYDISKINVVTEVNKYSTYIKIIEQSVIDKLLDDNLFKGAKTVNEVKVICDGLTKSMSDIANKYTIKLGNPLKDNKISADVLSTYIKHNVFDKNFVKVMLDVESNSIDAHYKFEKLDVADVVKAIEEELEKHKVSDADKKAMGGHMRTMFSTITSEYKRLAKSYTDLIGNVRVWDGVVVKHMKLSRILIAELDLEKSIKNPSVSKITL